jgi:hypothetical protein
MHQEEQGEREHDLGGEKVEIDTKEKDVQEELVKPKTIERKKYLLNVMMNVDVDEIAAKVAAQYFFRLGREE